MFLHHPNNLAVSRLCQQIVLSKVWRTMDEGSGKQSSSPTDSMLERGVQEIGLDDETSETKSQTRSPNNHALENTIPSFASGTLPATVSTQQSHTSTPAAPATSTVPTPQSHRPTQSSSAASDERRIEWTTAASPPTSSQGWQNRDQTMGAASLPEAAAPTALSSFVAVSASAALEEEDCKPSANSSSNTSQPMCVQVAVTPVAACSSTASAEGAGSAVAEDKAKKKRSSKSRSSSSDSKEAGHSTGRWTDAEHQAFLRGLHLYGREWKKVASHIPTRTSAQVRSHAQKYFTKMQRDQDAFVVLSSSASTSSQNRASQVGDGSVQDAAAAGSGAPTVVSEAAAAAAAAMIPGLTPSIQSTVARILSNPESVEAEVEDTLQRLRERYAQLQQRLLQADQSSGNNPAPVPIDPPSPTSLRGRKRPAAEQDVAASLGSANSLPSSHGPLQDEELIALSVLQGVLPRSGNSASSASNDTSSEMGTMDNSTGCSTNAEGEDAADDETLNSNGSNSSNKRTKTGDASTA